MKPARGEKREAYVRLRQEATENGISDSWEPDGDSVVCADCAEHGHDESGFHYHDPSASAYYVWHCASHEPGVGEVGRWMCEEHILSEAVDRDTTAKRVIFGDEPGEIEEMTRFEDAVLFAKLRDRLFDVAQSQSVKQRIEANVRVTALVRDALKAERSQA